MPLYPLIVSTESILFLIRNPSNVNFLLNILNFCCGNYSRRKLNEEIWYSNTYAFTKLFWKIGLKRASLFCLNLIWEIYFSLNVLCAYNAYHFKVNCHKTCRIFFLLWYKDKLRNYSAGPLEQGGRGYPPPPSPTKLEDMKTLIHLGGRGQLTPSTFGQPIWFLY